MLGLSAAFSTLFAILIHNAHAQVLTVGPESIVPLLDKFDMEIPAPDVPPEITLASGNGKLIRQAGCSQTTRARSCVRKRPGV
jgi:hypothetical protein